jgi:hypothetical protein
MTPSHLSQYTIPDIFRRRIPLDMTSYIVCAMTFGRFDTSVCIPSFGGHFHQDSSRRIIIQK